VFKELKLRGTLGYKEPRCAKDVWCSRTAGFTGSSVFRRSVISVKGAMAAGARKDPRGSSVFEKHRTLVIKDRRALGGLLSLAAS